MTCGEFKVMLFYVNGPERAPENTRAILVHTKSCASCYKIFMGIMRKAVDKQLNDLPKGKYNFSNPDPKAIRIDFLDP